MVPPRPILPAPSPTVNNSSEPTSSSSARGEPSTSGAPITSQILHPRRELVKVACDKCRAKKVKCDGKRPACTRCSNRAYACQYDSNNTDETRSQSLKRRYEQASSETSAYEQAVRILAQLPEKESLEHLRRLRADSNASITQMLSTGHHDFPGPVSPSATRSLADNIDAALDKTSVPQSVIPYQRENIEFELAVRHPIAYPTFLPAHPELLASETLLRPSRAGRLPFDPVHDGSRSSPDRLQQQTDHEAPAQSSRPASNQPPSLLKDLLSGRAEPFNIRRWTDVPIDDELAIEALSMYFQVDHRILPVLHEELFLRDLIEGKTEFCNKFLISSLMSWACQIYAACDRRAAPLGVAFFHNSQGLAEAEGGLRNLISVSAFQFLSMTALSYARDDLSLQHLEMGVRIGTDMGLFNVAADSEKARSWLNCDVRTIAAAQSVAWGVFNWFCLHGLHYHKAVISASPSLPLPGDNSSASGKQPRQSAAQELRIKVFRASCQLWLIFLDVLCVYYDGQASRLHPASVEYTETTYRQLLRWAGDLPLDLVWGPDSNFEVLMLHVYFHTIVMHLFRPPIQIVQPPALLQSFEAPNSSIARAYAASSHQLRQLVLAIRLHHNEQGTLSILWHTGLIYLANATLQGTASLQGETTEHRRFYFMLCVAGLEDLHVSFKVFGPITRGLLAMALEQGAIGGGEAARLERNLRVAEPRHEAVDNLINGPELVQWIIDLDRAVEDPQAAQGSSLADQFSKLMIMVNVEGGTAMDTSGPP